MSKYLLFFFFSFCLFFLGVELCYFFFFSFLFTPSFFVSFGVALFFFFRCWTFSFFFLGGAEFVLRVFGLFSLFLIFWGLVFSLSLSFNRLNKPLRNRFLLVLSRFSDRLRGTMVTQSKTISWTICPSSGTKYVYVPYSQWTLCAK